ncbi:MAG TPA: methyltransferase domain-containing protein, partial [Armatimonadota bacterium]|nr:methyltransferase domain-containing protein [Armatimonadota bacterium]
MAKQSIVCNYSDVDHVSDTDFSIGYLDNVRFLDGIKKQKQASFALMQMREGTHVLDVGCGTGDDVCEMARQVGKSGKAIGVDNSQLMINEARKRSEDLNLPVEYYVGDALHLGFPDTTFDACRADRVFQHLESPQQALAEMIRVTRSGAHLVVSDCDWGTLAIASRDIALTRKITDFYCNGPCNGLIGRMLYSLFKQAGLLDVTVTPYTFTQNDLAIADQMVGIRKTVALAQQNQ